MPRFKKKTKRKRPSRLRRYFHRKDKRISIIGTIGGIGSIFAASPGKMSMGEWFLNTVQGKSPNLMEPTNVMNMTADTLKQYLGYDFRDGSWGIPTGTVVLLGSALTANLVGKVTKNKTFQGVPIIGKYIKW